MVVWARIGRWWPRRLRHKKRKKNLVLLAARSAEGNASDANRVEPPAQQGAAGATGATADSRCRDPVRKSGADMKDRMRRIGGPPAKRDRVDCGNAKTSSLESGAGSSGSPSILTPLSSSASETVRQETSKRQDDSARTVDPDAKTEVPTFTSEATVSSRSLLPRVHWILPSSQSRPRADGGHPNLPDAGKEKPSQVKMVSNT